MMQPLRSKVWAASHLRLADAAERSRFRIPQADVYRTAIDARRTGGHRRQPNGGVEGPTSAPTNPHRRTPMNHCTILRGSVQPCESCGGHAAPPHIRAERGHPRVFSVLCERCCQACQQARAERLRELLRVAGIEATRGSLSVSQHPGGVVKLFGRRLP